MYENTNYSTLAAYQATSTFDASSLEVDPTFNDMITGTFCLDTLDNRGTPMSYIMDDFNGYTRDMNTPDVGAHEFYSLGQVDLGPDTTLCQTDYVLTVGDSNLVSSVVWTVNGVSSTAPTYVVSTNGASESFTIEANVTTGCGSASDVVDVTLVPNVSFPDSMHICAGETVTLDAEGGPNSSYAWFPTNEVTSAIDINTPGYYSVTKMEDGCESQASTTVTQSAGVSIADVEPCDANLPATVNATIPNGVSYTWSDGSTGTSNDFSDDGDYAVTATDSYGCTSVDSFNVTVIDVPKAKVTETHVGTTYYFSSSTSENVGNNATYLWDFNDGNLSSLANPTHTYAWVNPSQPTQYLVTLTITNQCGQDDDGQVISPDVLGVNELTAETNYKVYPNPSAGLVNVEFMGTTGENVSLRVIDVTGRIISTQNANTAEITTVDLSSVAAGTYILEVNMNGNISNTRVSIK